MRQAVTSIMSGEFDSGHAPWAMIDVGQPNKLTRISQIHTANEQLYRMVTDGRIGELAAKVTGAKRIRIWGSQLYFKPADSGAGAVVGFHRDAQHMPFFKAGSFTAWLPLTDIALNSGPLIYVAGSHRWDLNDQSSGAQIQQFAAQCQQLRAEYAAKSWQEHPMLLPAGGISFHHQNLIHGSDVNASQQARCVIGLGLLTERFAIDSSQADYGYADILDDPYHCPMIYG